jgi:hypothetical protein
MAAGDTMCVLNNADGILRGREVRILGFQSGLPQQYIFWNMSPRHGISLTSEDK